MRDQQRRPGYVAWFLRTIFNALSFATVPVLVAAAIVDIVFEMFGLR